MTIAPLFGGMPGGPEMLIMLLMMILMLVPVGIAVWVTLDARGRTDHPLAWGAATFLAGFSPFFVGTIAVAVLYLLVRDELGSTAPPTFSESDMDESAQVLGQPLGGQEETLEPEEKLESEEGAEEDFEFGDHEPEEGESESEGKDGEGEDKAGGEDEAGNGESERERGREEAERDSSGGESERGK